MSKLKVLETKMNKSFEKMAKQKNVYQTEKEMFNEQKQLIISEFEIQVRNKFEGININLQHNESQFKITIGKQFILEHLYNDSSFEIIDKKLYKELIAIYEDTYGEPIDIPINYCAQVSTLTRAF